MPIKEQWTRTLSAGNRDITISAGDYALYIEHQIAGTVGGVLPLTQLTEGKAHELISVLLAGYRESFGKEFVPGTPTKPIPMRLICEGCGELHIDEGEFETYPHTTHVCQHCGLTWKPAKVPTVGVRFLPGYKNEEK